MNSAPIFPARWDWPSTIGHFLLNFGVLDYLLVVYLKDNLEPSEFAKVKESHFKDRASGISKHLRDNNVAPEHQQEFERLQQRLNPVRDLRNHIAHGYLVFHSPGETEAPEVFISLPKDVDHPSSPETRRLTFDELRAALSELTELIEAFKRFAGFRTEGPDA